ncbi:hypothetical protein FOA52_008176 [Chlamydomonas sp. UWO 241]|nr:hypothetical protein FOA52_008176 [Chlamydomonas sp. UWO 241]
MTTVFAQAPLEGWFEADDEARNARITEEKYSLTLFEKFRLMDKYMPLHLQLFAVLINSFFVLYEGWASAALSPFACQDIDDGTVLESEEYYYANYQQAVNSRGYWQLNMNQACYKGEHLSKWTPIGIVMSIIVCGTTVRV